jgi:hypothetical protein
LRFLTALRSTLRGPVWNSNSSSLASSASLKSLFGLPARSLQSVCWKLENSLVRHDEEKSPEKRMRFYAPAVYFNRAKGPFHRCLAYARLCGCRTFAIFFGRRHFHAEDTSLKRDGAAIYCCVQQSAGT